MSDNALRELERRFRVSRSVEDEGAWLRARSQAGELLQEDLNLAAFLGYVPARIASPQQETLAFSGDWHALARQLQDWGLHATLRATVAAVRVSRLGSLNLLRIEQVEDWLCGLEPEPDPAGDSGFPLHSGLPGYWLGQIWTKLDVVPNVPRRLEGVTSWAMSGGESMRWAKVSEVSAANAFLEEVVPWALGYRDIVLERVEARTRAAK